MISQTHHQIADEIEQLVKEERYREAQQRLPGYVAALTDFCSSGGDAQEVARAEEFIVTTLQLVRSRRAHCMAELAELEQQRAYLTEPEGRGPGATLDISG